MAENETDLNPPEISAFSPDIRLGAPNSPEAELLQNWIETTTSTLTSAPFENNLSRVAERYPQVWVSRTRDAMQTAELRDVLHADDSLFPSLWWPKTSVVLRGDETTDLARTGADTETKGEIEIGRMHYRRYTEGDMVERSCAINTLAHEISHTLSDRADEFWMHFLDTAARDNAPPNMYQASYLVGTVAQCTWLQEQERVAENEFFDCLLTFSDPSSGSRFRSRACNDFPNDKPVTPEGRLDP
ncbi:hypothetical protein [Litorimonas sp. WD9-15]|uniref:hypothetical protein n=1 Tax=Litorimonas sp. WD9-15 TaxID=3418716 RepID=UPI003D021A70